MKKLVIQNLNLYISLILTVRYLRLIKNQILKQLRFLIHTFMFFKLVKSFIIIV